MENEVLKAIKERRSIRRFKADQITDEELKTVLEAGTWAATGHGTQEPFIIAVQNPEICAQLRKMNADPCLRWSKPDCIARILRA